MANNPSLRRRLKRTRAWVRKLKKLAEKETDRADLAEFRLTRRNRKHKPAGS